ncbi:MULTISPECIES: alpha/beta fold hydrolase [Campylobacter]|uniref:alpha/beta fold hydrolase n=1 Tax=Campylobacter TaxID=194 RepID=UPI00027A3502|nr:MULTISPECIES: alpha/beta hydrolase [Campylobacter]EJP76117.1 alpha/beta hydrolase family protein [Campylobacter sp. FOBRC14]
MKIRNLLIAAFVTIGVNAPAKEAKHHYFAQTSKSYQSKNDYGNNEAVGHYVNSKDTKIYYEIYGKGSPIVLLHGGLVGSPADMSELADKLREDRKVILVATRGHGRSQIGGVVPSFEQKADDVSAVLDDLGISRSDIIGFSDGAYTAYLFAKKYPQKVRNLIAIGAGVWEKGFVQGSRAEMKTFEDLKNLDKRYWNEQLDGVRPEPERILLWFEQVMEYYDSASVGEEVFKNVNARTLMIVGEKDANAPLDTVIAAYEMLPNAQLGIVPNAPHPVLLTDFDIVWPMISKFLSKQ